MATGGYKPSHSSTMGSRYDHRRTSGSTGSMYDRPPVAPGQHRTPSPSNSRRGYDNFGPPRSAPTFREESHSHRPNVYRPDYSSNSFYGPPSEGDRFSTAESRPYHRDYWEQTKQGWQGGSYGNTHSWQDPREPIPPSPTGSARSHGRIDILATRMFDSPEGPKPTPVDRWVRHEGQSYSQERYYDPPSRSAQEPIMDSLPRPTPRPNFNAGADRFRHPPPPKRASHPNMRSEYDPHRAPFDKRDQRGPFHREPHSPRSHRMDSTPTMVAPSRSWGQFEPSFPNSRNSRFPSASHSRSPERRASVSASSSPHRREAPRVRNSWDANETSVKKELSRQSSLSSIASTQVSDAQPARDMRQGSKAPNTSSAPLDPSRSASGPLGESSSGPSSTCSSPRQLPSSVPPVTLTNRFKNLNSAGPVSSPLSSVVTAESEAEAPKPSIKEPPSANGETSAATKSPLVASPTTHISPLAELPVNLPCLEQTVGNHSLNGSTEATAQGDVSSPVPASLEQICPEDQTKQENPPPVSQIDSAPTTISVVEGTLMDVDKSDDLSASLQSTKLELQPSFPKEVSEPAKIEQAPAFTRFGTVSSFQSTAFTFGSRPEVSPDDDLDLVEDTGLPETETMFDEEQPPKEPVILLQLKPLFPHNAPAPTEKPSLKEASSLQEALRGVVMTRLVYDKQTRDNLVNPVLLSNRALVDACPPPLPTSKSTPHHLIAEVHRRLDETLDFPTVRESLAAHFEERQNLINDKAHRLSEEYLRLHKKWKAHCEILDAQQRINTNEAEQLLHGRTTRRTAAFTDTVRSDLEMEQVIASLGVDDLTDPSYLSSRNSAIIPDMISVTKGEVDFHYDDTNHLVADPEEYYGPHTGIDDWTDDEKRIFIDKFAMYPKQFGLIADHIPHKTAAQCVDYYYLHKKRIIDFRKVVSQLAPSKRKKRGGGKKKGNALLADIAQHDAEVGKDHPPTFIVPTRVAKGKRRGRAAAVKAQSSTPANASTPQPEVASVEAIKQSASQAAKETPLDTPTPEPEGRPKRSNRKSGVGTAQPSTASTPVPAPAPPAQEQSPIAPIQAPVLVSVNLLPLAAPDNNSNALASPAAAPSPLSADPDSPQKLAKKVKRGRKQVKSAAIILDDSPSPPADPDAVVPLNGAAPEE